MSVIRTQLIATSGALMLLYQTGLIDGWTSPNIARLTSINSTLSLTLSEASWLASYLKLGRFASVILVPIFIELAGSRKAILFTFIPVSVCWILMIVAKSAICLYIARFLSGITIGLAYGIYSIYLGEISIPNLRGTLNSISVIGWPLGTLISTVSEAYLSETMSCTIYLVACLLGMALFAWLPESPYQLVKDKHLEKAKESLVWYRGCNDTNSEMKEIVEFVESTNRVSLKDKLKQLNSRHILKAVMLVSMVFTYPQLCGVLNVTFYMQIILTNGKSYLLSPINMVIVTNGILLLVNMVAFNVIDKFGRKVVLVISSVSMMIALFGLGLHFYLIENTDIDPTKIEELPVVAIVILLIAYSIGFSPVTSTLLGEMFPVGIKSIVATIVTFVASFAGFVSTKSYQPLIDAIGETYVFWTYSAFAASAIPFVIFFLPETKGKSLQEIQKILNKG